MSYTEGLGVQGEWNVVFKTDQEGGIPRDVLEQLDYFGHIVITSPWVDLDLIGDPLPLSRYTGVLLQRNFTDGAEISGAGLLNWLGTEDDIGDINEADVNFLNDSFATAIGKVLPPAIVAGTIYSQAPKTMTGTIQGLTSTPLKSLEKVMVEFGTEYRITPQGYLNAGTEAQLYPSATDPTTILLPREKDSGDDPAVKSIPLAEAVQSNDRRGYATRTVLAAEGEGDTIALAAANLSPGTTYKDLQGNTLVRKKIISESDTDGGLAPTRALAHLATSATLRRELTVTTEDYAFEGDWEVGDTVWGYDELSDLEDPANEVWYKGRRYQPTKVRIVGATRPITAQHGVYYRTAAGQYIDLTQWVEPEDGPVTIEVGAFGRPLVGDPNEQLGPRIVADSSVPAIPVFSPFVSAVYEDDNGVTRGSITASWSTPVNTDGTAVVDGAYYTVGWRRTGSGGQYQFVDVPWGTNTVTIQDLPIAVSFDFIIQASDAAKPPNRSGFSSSVTVVAGTDISAPSTPAAPVVAGGPLRIMVEHSLGKQSGGTFNLEDDLHHLNVYADTTSTFTPGVGNFKGQIAATKTHINMGIKVLGTFAMDDDTPRWVRVTAVDNSGNESDPSNASTVTALLIQDQFIENVSANKLTAGTVSVSVLLTAAHIQGGIVETAAAGQRVAMEEGAPDRFKLYTGDAIETTPGSFRSQVVGSGSARYLNLILSSPEISGGRGGQIAAFSDSTDASIEASAELRSFSGLTIDAQIRASRSNVSGWIGTATGRRWVLTDTVVNLLYGADTQPGVVLNSTAAEIRTATTGRKLFLDGTGAILAYAIAGSRVIVLSDRTKIVDSTNTTGFEVLVDRVNNFNNFALNNWPLYLKGAGTTARLEGGDNPILFGVGGCQLRVDADDVGFMVGSAFAEAAVINPAADDYRHLQVNILTYDALVPRSDRRLKTAIRELDPADCEDIMLSTPARRFEWKSKPGEEVWGFVAQETPNIARRQTKHIKHGDIAAYDPSAMLAIAWTVARNSVGRLNDLDQRLRILEEAMSR